MTTRNPNFPPPPPEESEHIADPFSPLDADNLEQLRITQKEILTQEEDGARLRQGHELLLQEGRDQAKKFAEQRWENLLTEYVHSFDDVEDYDKLREDVEKFSLGHMNDRQWYQGEKDEGGNPLPSGRERTYQMHEELLEEYRRNHEPEELEEPELDEED